MDRINVVADTREQKPYDFDPARIVTTRRGLPTGDYSIAGLEDRVAVERKTLDDFVSTVIWSRERFKRELDRLRSFEAACVVVEGNLSDLARGCYRSQAKPSALLGILMAIIVDHQIPVYFCSDRQVACRFVEGFLLRFHRKVTQQCSKATETGE